MMTHRQLRRPRLRARLAHWAARFPDGYDAVVHNADGTTWTLHVNRH